MNPEQLPQELRRFQASNFATLGALDDLARSALNILGRDEEVELEKLFYRRKNKKTIIIIAISLFVALACAAGSLFALWPEEDEPEKTIVLTNDDYYNSALALLNEEKYLEAAKEFDKIFDFKDSSNQIKKIYDRYDGYYQNEDQTCSLYLNIIDGKTSEFSFEKIVNNKLIKIEDSILVENNQINGKYIDSFSNSGQISLTLNDETIELTISTIASDADISIGEFNITFRIENKTDRPLTRTVTKDLLLEWISTQTYIDDIKALGYELEVYEPMGEGGTVGTLYTVANTDISLLTVDFDMTRYDGSDWYAYPDLKGNAIYAIIAPAQFIYPEKINQSACVFSENDIVYVPNGNTIGMDSTHSDWKWEENQHFINLAIADPYMARSGTTETLTLEELTINPDSTIAFASKNSIGKYNYDLIIEENLKAYYKTLVLQQYQKDNPNSTEMFVEPHILSEKDGILLLNFHARKSNDGLVTTTSGSFNYYRFDISTKNIEFIVKHDQVTYVNQYGSISYSYDDFKNYPDLFGEFLPID